MSRPWVWHAEEGVLLVDARVAPDWADLLEAGLASKDATALLVRAEARSSVADFGVVVRRLLTTRDGSGVSDGSGGSEPWDATVYSVSELAAKASVSTGYVRRLCRAGALFSVSRMTARGYVIERDAGDAWLEGRPV